MYCWAGNEKIIGLGKTSKETRGKTVKELDLVTMAEYNLGGSGSLPMTYVALIFSLHTDILFILLMYSRACHMISTHPERWNTWIFMIPSSTHWRPNSRRIQSGFSVSPTLYYVHSPQQSGIICHANIYLQLEFRSHVFLVCQSTWKSAGYVR